VAGIHSPGAWVGFDAEKTGRTRQAGRAEFGEELFDEHALLRLRRRLAMGVAVIALGCPSGALVEVTKSAGGVLFRPRSEDEDVDAIFDQQVNQPPTVTVRVDAVGEGNLCKLVTVLDQCVVQIEQDDGRSKGGVGFGIQIHFGYR